MTAPSTAPRPTTVLVVDDTPEDRRLAGAVIEKELGWKVTYAEDGWSALEMIEKGPPSLVLTDLQMPKLNGLRLVTSVRRKHPNVPIVLMTSHGSEEIALEALQAGAASYIPKRNLDTDLADVLSRVLAASNEEERKHALLGRLDHVEFAFTLENDRLAVPDVVAHLQPYLERMGLADHSARTRIAVALEEALLNAMYHGNLELSSDLRQNGDEPFYQAAEERKKLPKYHDRHVRFSARLTREAAHFVITDQGPGFDPQAVPDPTDPDNLDKGSGRGLLLIRTFMDHVEFNDRANQITMVKRRETTPTS
jgi:CheY-like chemotaxis protein